jgi:hypothetical protein
MAGDEQNTFGMVPGPVGEFIAQLRAMTEGLEGLAREHLPPMPGAFPLPGTLSAAQLASIADSIAAQRRSVEALKAQLSAFDEQLAALEQILGPLAQWSSKWAGRTVDFRNTVIIMTSNIGSEYLLDGVASDGELAVTYEDPA